jgi:hypothetical protein
MARIYRDSSVLNQYGSPSLNSNTFANRPAFGQPGRLFVDTTNNVIYRDTGTSWVIVGGSGSTPSLQTVTSVGNTSSNGIFLGASGTLTNGLIFEVSGYTRMQQTVASASNLGASNIKNFTFQTSGTTVATGNPSPDLNQLFVDIQVAQTVGGAGNLQIGAGLFENVISGTDNLLLTVTQTVGLSALSPLISYQRYINNGDSTITHTAGIVINGLQRTGAGVLNVTNNYQLLVNSSQQFASTSTVTNRWGVYQNGANDNNYFAGKINIGNSNTTINTSTLNVSGTSQFISTSTTGTSIILGNTSFQWNFNTSIVPQILSLGYGANNFLNIGYDAPDGLIKIYNGGNINFSTNYFSVGGDPNSPISSAKINIESITKGALIPRMTTAQIKAIATPVNGLLAYSTDDFVLSFYDSSTSLWKRVVHINL